jgi:zinc transport system permease protein
MAELYAWLARLAADGRLPQAFAYPFITRGLIAVLLLAPLLGGISHLVVARRMSFFSTAIGQAALTGLTIGLALGEPITAPYGGMFGFCFLCAIGVAFLKRRGNLPPDTLIGVFMALTLGLGICLLVAATRAFNIHQIDAVMFGSLLTVTDLDLAILLVAAIVVLAVLARSYNAILLDSLAPSLAEGEPRGAMVLEYLFVTLLTAAIVVSLKVVGALLVEALVVVPAAAARNLAKTTKSYVGFSVAAAFVSGVSGVFVSTRWAVPTGGAVVLALSALFFITLALRALAR